MTLLFTTIVIICILLKYMIFLDIIVSWLTLLGLKLRPKFVADIVDPIYQYIKKNIPTTLGPIDFTPIIILIFLEFFILFIYGLSPQTFQYINNLFNNF